MTQLALAWLLAQRDDIVPIPGTRNPARVAENVAAADVRLTDDDLARSTKSFRTARSEAVSRGDDAAVVKRSRRRQSFVTRV